MTHFCADKLRAKISLCFPRPDKVDQNPKFFFDSKFCPLKNRYSGYNFVEITLFLYYFDFGGHRKSR